MKLQYITCSDMREHNSIDEIINLGSRYPMSEFAVQAHPSKFAGGKPRNVWFCALMAAARDKKINLAMHVNSEWRAELCRGNIPYDIKHIWDMRRDDGKPFIGRVQININGGKDLFTFHSRKIADIIRAYPDIEFIFQYTKKQHGRILRLDKKKVPFSMLFDASGGNGQLPDSWQAPILSNHKMGYSGGLSPENIIDNLDKINVMVPTDYRYENKVWVDAEGKLKNPGTGLFDTARAERYIKNALAWQK